MRPRSYHKLNKTRKLFGLLLKCSQFHILCRVIFYNLLVLTHTLWQWYKTRLGFYQTRSAWSMDQGSNQNHYPMNNFTPTVTKFCVMWEGQALPHDTKFRNCRGRIVDSRAFPSWSLIPGSSWSGLIKVGPGLATLSLKDMGEVDQQWTFLTCNLHIDGLVQDYSNPRAIAMELVQSFTTPSIKARYVIAFNPWGV